MLPRSRGRPHRPEPATGASTARPGPDRARLEIVLSHTRRPPVAHAVPDNTADRRPRPRPVRAASSRRCRSSPPTRSAAADREKYGALFYLGVGGLVVIVALVGWFAWQAWSLRDVWTNVYILHDARRSEPDRVQAAYALAQRPAGQPAAALGQRPEQAVTAAGPLRPGRGADRRGGVGRPARLRRSPSRRARAGPSGSGSCSPGRWPTPPRSTCPSPRDSLVTLSQQPRPRHRPLGHLRPRRRLRGRPRRRPPRSATRPGPTAPTATRRRPRRGPRRDPASTTASRPSTPPRSGSGPTTPRPPASGKAGGSRAAGSSPRRRDRPRNCTGTTRSSGAGCRCRAPTRSRVRSVDTSNGKERHRCVSVGSRAERRSRRWPSAAWVAVSGPAQAQESKADRKAAVETLEGRLEREGTGLGRDPQGRAPVKAEGLPGSEPGTPTAPADDQHQRRLARLGPRPVPDEGHRPGQEGRRQGPRTRSPPSASRPTRTASVVVDDRPRHPRRDPVPLARRRDRARARGPRTRRSGRRPPRSPSSSTPRTSSRASSSRSISATSSAKNLASTVSVIRPIGGPDSGSADKPK